MFPNAYLPWGLLQPLSGYSLMEICFRYYCAKSKAKTLEMSHMDYKNNPFCGNKLKDRINTFMNPDESIIKQHNIIMLEKEVAVDQ